MKLHFTPEPYLDGVELDSHKAKDKDFDRAEELYKELVEDIPELSLAADEKGRILYLYIELYGDRPIGGLEYLSEKTKNFSIPGFYTVPELGLKNVSFDVVLEKVKEYYERVEKFILKKSTVSIPHRNIKANRGFSPTFDSQIGFNPL